MVEGRKGEQALSLRLLETPPSLSKAHRKAPEQMTVIVEDLIKMLDAIGNAYRRGRHPDGQDRRQGGHRAARRGRRAGAVASGDQRPGARPSPKPDQIAADAVDLARAAAVEAAG